LADSATTLCPLCHLFWLGRVGTQLSARVKRPRRSALLVVYCMVVREWLL
jgi:hypothetical protein